MSSSVNSTVPRVGPDIQTLDTNHLIGSWHLGANHRSNITCPGSSPVDDPGGDLPTGEIRILALPTDFTQVFNIYL